MIRVTDTQLRPEEWDWKAMLSGDIIDPIRAGLVGRLEMEDRIRDAEELRWLLGGIRRELSYYKAIAPDDPFESELADAFSRRLDALEQRASAYIERPEDCVWDAYLTLKYEVRKLYKQLGGIVTGSDWQTPGKQLRHGEQTLTDESGFAQEEEGTYQRCYGSEAVKDYESMALDAFYKMPAELRGRCVLF